MQISYQTLEVRTTIENLFKSKPKSYVKPLQNLVCDVCSKSYETKRKYTRHLKQVHPEKISDKKCHFCDFNSSQAPVMKAHVLQNHKDICKNCNDCNEYFASNQDLHNHNSKVHDKRFYECELCKTDFNQLQLFQNHQSDIHDLKLFCYNVFW